MTKPDLMAELATFVRLDEVAIELSYYDGIGEREDRDEFAVNFLRTHHAELEAVVRDAARYRWLRNDPPLALSVRKREENRSDWTVYLYIDGQELDAAIDQAMHNSAREG